MTRDDKQLFLQVWASIEGAPMPMVESLREPTVERLQEIIDAYTQVKVKQALLRGMRDPVFLQHMDEIYEERWKHRFE